MNNNNVGSVEKTVLHLYKKVGTPEIVEFHGRYTFRLNNNGVKTDITCFDDIKEAYGSNATDEFADVKLFHLFMQALENGIIHY